jgi:feruloyl esterase
MYLLPPLLSLLAFATQGAKGSTSSHTTACASLADVKFSSFQIRFTATIAKGSNFTGDSTETSYNALQTSLPNACRVAAVIQTSANSSARFEIWFPAEKAWNGRFLATGNGGWAGGVNYPDVVTGLKLGMYSKFYSDLFSID